MVPRNWRTGARAMIPRSKPNGAAARSIPPGDEVVRMKDELPTILEAIRAAQAELAAYLNSADRNAELTIAKLVGILERREVVRAMRLLAPHERAAIAQQSTLAKAS